MTVADALALLDTEGSERFALPEGMRLTPAVDLPYETVAQALDDPRVFLAVVAGGASLSYGSLRGLQRHWRDQQGLVDGDDLSRLLWIVGTFSREIEVDLLQRVGVRLGDLWQRREWRLLLNLIDHLPRATWSWQAMANHPDYAAKLADAVAHQLIKADAGEPASAPLVEYSPEVAALAAVVDAVNGLKNVLIQVNLEKGKQPPPVTPYPRPRTVVDSLVGKREHSLRMAAHESLVSRVLPGRTPT